MANDSSAQEAMNNLTAQWFNVITTGLNLDPGSFQMAQGFQSLNTDSNVALWNTMNAVPPNAINSYWDPGQFNNFSQDYGSIIQSMVLTSQDSFTPCMGGNTSDDYKSWTTFLMQQKPWPETADLPSLFNRWAAMFAPAKVGCAGAFAQLLNDSLNLNLLNYSVASNQGVGPFAYNVSIKDVNKLFRDQVTRMTLNSKTSSTDISSSFSKTVKKVFFGIYSSSKTESTYSKKAMSSGIDVSIEINRILTQPVGPLAQADPENEVLKNYTPWFNSAVMDRAFKNSDDSVWKSGGETNWDDNFGSNGKLTRLSTALVLIDDFTTKISSSATYNSVEQSEITELVSGGVWPFYRANTENDKFNSVSFDDAGKMTMTTTSPKGQPAILGVLTKPITSILG